ncbi:MAG: signal peptidase I [Nitrososphaeria archaeon]|nr:signal peptidase I [Nitrososphaeria archaeon]
MKISKSKRNILENIFFATLLIITVIMLASLVLGTSPFYYVEGNSMHPTLENGDLIIIYKIDFKNLQVGDIIVFNSPVYNVRIVHRIKEIKIIDNEMVLITQGDNNRVPDPGYVREENYVGKYMGIRIPYVGYIGQLLSPPVNYILIAVLLAYFVYTVFVEELKKGEKRKQ